MTITDPARLWRVQLALECKTFDSAGRLVPVPCADPDPLPSCYAVRYSDGATELAFAAAAPEWFVLQVGRHPIADVMRAPAAVINRFRADRHEVVVDHFHTYCFDAGTPTTRDPKIIGEAAESYSIMIDGERVAGASSSRSDVTAAELWIETDPAHRRRGYAAALAQAWASGVHQAGKIAFYSHLHANEASGALARRLGVRPLFEIVALDLVE